MKILSIGLVSCLLIISGLLSSQVAAHSIHHAQHNADTHSTTLCSWACAAAETLDNAYCYIDNQPILADQAEIWIPAIVAVILPTLSLARSPPV